LFAFSAISDLSNFKKVHVYMKIKAIVHQAEEGGYWAEVPALPGCITEGDTMEELENNLKDAIEGWLEVANDNHTVENDTQILEVAV
jgi:predicted RNase H-like HicB family nuclease